MKNKFFLGLLFILSFVLVAGCSTATKDESTSNDSKEQNKGEVNLYTSRHYETDDALYNAFTKGNRH